MSLRDFETNLRAFLPEESLEPVISLIKTRPFHLKITPSRKTKKGDFRPNLSGGLHKISVNGSMNKFEFLITFIHEYAHLITWDEHKNKVKAHGPEWKRNFESTLRPFVGLGCFPPEIKLALTKHLKNPKASSCVDLELQRTLSQYDPGPKSITLEDIEVGSKFRYGDDKVFTKGEKRRTRIKCLSMNNGRHYLFYPLTPVEPLL